MNFTVDSIISHCYQKSTKLYQKTFLCSFWWLFPAAWQLSTVFIHPLLIQGYIRVKSSCRGVADQAQSRTNITPCRQLGTFLRFCGNGGCHGTIGNIDGRIKRRVLHWQNMWIKKESGMRCFSWIQPAFRFRWSHSPAEYRMSIIKHFENMWGKPRKNIGIRSLLTGNRAYGPAAFHLTFLWLLFPVLFFCCNKGNTAHWAECRIWLRKALPGRYLSGLRPTECS